MRSYEIVTLLVCLAALFAYINARYVRMQQTIGIMTLSLVFSILAAISVKLFSFHSARLTLIISSIDFHNLLMNGMLSFLLFAGSVQIDAINLKKEKWPILVLSTVGIFISTFLVGTLLYFLFYAFHLNVGYVYCLLFRQRIQLRCYPF